MSSPEGSVTPVHDFVSPTNLKIFLWISTGLMTATLAVRVYIRVACFRRLIIEDWLMLASLACFYVMTILATVYVDSIYHLNHLVDGSFTPGPNFESDAQHSLRASAATSITTYVGLWLVKVNFLLFFYRLGSQLPRFLLIWWLIFAFVMASGVVQIGIIKFDCMIGNDLHTMLQHCSTLDNLYETRLICFPVSILWVSRIKFRQKLILTALFSLVLFVIAITVVRGEFSTNIQDPSAAAQLNTSAIFWAYLEFLVYTCAEAFLVACSVSFRSLFVQQRNRDTGGDASRRAQQQRRSTDSGGAKGSRRRLGGRLRQWHNSILDTCKELEGADADIEINALPQPASALITLDFSEGEAPSDWTTTANTSHENRNVTNRTSSNGSVISLKTRQTPQSQV
ncbi:hypothetical protein PG985_000665 [Apiospora marii]|uniref:Rhodopsin domain-containing protein n=1 Tax=Apiospora marii TaxID=335849 RepID=A0ABR1R2T4_9PEZI